MEKSADTARAWQWPISISWWEAAIAAPLVFVVAVFVLAHHYPSAVVVAAVTALLFVWRAEIVERRRPGGFTRVRGRLLMIQWCAMAAIYVLVLAILFIATFNHWTHSRTGLVAVYASAGLGFFLARELKRSGDMALDHLAGSDAEVRVAAVLDRFRDRGWVVVHDLKKDYGGNVDHLLLGPDVAFAVETKSGRENAQGRGQALSGAAWAKDKYQRRWVNAVLCVATDPPSAPKKIGKAWVTSLDDLESLLNRPPSAL